MDFNFTVFAAYSRTHCACRLVPGEAEPLSDTSHCSQWALHQGGPCSEPFTRAALVYEWGAFCTHSNLSEADTQDCRAGFKWGHGPTPDKRPMVFPEPHDTSRKGDSSF